MTQKNSPVWLVWYERREEPQRGAEPQRGEESQPSLEALLSFLSHGGIPGKNV